MARVLEEGVAASVVIRLGLAPGLLENGHQGPAPGLSPEGAVAVVTPDVAIGPRLEAPEGRPIPRVHVVVPHVPRAALDATGGRALTGRRLVPLAAPVPGPLKVPAEGRLLATPVETLVATARTVTVGRPGKRAA